MHRHLQTHQSGNTKLTCLHCMRCASIALEGGGWGWLLSKVIILLDVPSRGGNQCILGLFVGLRMFTDLSELKWKKYWFRCLENDIKGGRVDCDHSRKCSGQISNMCMELDMDIKWFWVNVMMSFVILHTGRITFILLRKKDYMRLWFFLMNQFKAQQTWVSWWDYL